MPNRKGLPRPSKARTRWTTWGVVIVVGFLAATAFAQWRMRSIDGPALDIAENASPSIEELTAARSELAQLDMLLWSAPDSRRRDLVERVGLVRQRVDERINAYLVLPVFPGEQLHWGTILRGKEEFDSAVNHFERQAASGDVAAASVLAHDLSTDAEQLSAALGDDIEFNALQSHDLAMRIRRERAGSTYFAFSLDALAALLAVVGLVQLRRATRAHTALVDRHQTLLEERATEMEVFAGRVAHDIMSPLGTVSLALQLARTTGEAADRDRLLGRGLAALERVGRLVAGLLRFAQAGAKPDPGASADVQATIADMMAELGPTATEANVELTADCEAALHVACNTGVLTSLVANLARNAIRYIGDGDERRIQIRASAAGERVHVEVEDTGPGLPPGTEEQVFEPYVRGHGGTGPGIGLGLATVKRMTEAHGGRVGVRSVPGRGSTFWFELPRAEPQEAESGSGQRAQLAG